MTSANLSFSDKIKNHRRYIQRTLWLSLVLLPFYLIYYVLGSVMMVSRAINYARLYSQPAAELLVEKQNAILRIMGPEQIGFMLIMLTAVLFAFQGFGYVFNQSQMDFYLSQPTTRLQRIKKNYLNALGTFLVMYVTSEALGLICGAVLGAVSVNVLFQVLVETVRCLVLFFSVYNITVLAILLCGTLMSAILVTGSFALVSLVLATEFRLLKDIFYSTFSDLERFKVYFSPVFDRFYAIYKLSTIINDSREVASIKDKAQIFISLDFDIFITGIIAFVFVIILSKYRRAEMAGKSIVLRPFRWLVKVTLSFIVGLGAGYIVNLIYISVWNDRLYVMMCVVMIIATVLAGCLIEVILDLNIRRFHKGICQTIMATALVVLCFVIFRGDLTGFDSYLPNPERVKSCAILEYDYSYQSWRGGENIFENTARDNMEITDIDSFIEIARAGMETSREIAKQSDPYLNNSYYAVDILYRMKDGREIYRSIELPTDIDPELMDKVLGSEEYVTGHYPCFHDEIVRQEDEKYSATRSISFSTINDNLNTKDMPYSEFSDALRKDLLENFSYSAVKDEKPVALVEYRNNSEVYYIDATVPIYRSYSNVFSLMKKYGIYSEIDLDAAKVSKISVTNYYPGYDVDEDGHENIDYANVESISAEYTDPEKIKTILEKSVCNEYPDNWYNYNNLSNQYNVEVTMAGGSDSYGIRYFSFMKGEIPTFVIEDTNN